MRILALDIATECGWAHSCGESGTWDFRVKSDESSGMRLIRFRGKLEEIRSGVGVDLIVYEAAIQMGKRRKGAAVGAELQGVLKLWCVDNGVDFRSYAPTEIKKFATNNGNASKEKMVDFAERRWGRVFQDGDNNEVDALWLLALAKVDLGL